MEEFQLLDEECFDDFMNADNWSQAMDNCNNETMRFNYCPICEIPMDTVNSGYECATCGYLEHIDGDVKDCSDETTGTLRMNSGGKNGFYSINTNYPQTQKKAILNQLMNNNEHYKGPKFPKDVLMRTAALYNDIQKLIVFKDPNDQNGGMKKLVKRGDIKDEVLGAIIDKECIRAGVPRKKKDIAEFMNLSQGISRGDDILRNLHLDGKIDVPINEEPCQMYVDRYLEALDIDTPEHRGFILDLVEESFKKKIGMNSVISSKIVGAIWILISRKQLNIPSTKLETAADRIRKNTWSRFSREIEAHILKFIDVFRKWNVPHGVSGLLVRKSEINQLINDGLLTGYSIRTKPY